MEPPAFPGLLPYSLPSLFLARSLACLYEGPPVPGVSWVIKEGAEGSVPEEPRMQAGQEGHIVGITEDAQSGLICYLNVEIQA